MEQEVIGIGYSCVSVVVFWTPSSALIAIARRMSVGLAVVEHDYLIDTEDCGRASNAS